MRSLLGARLGVDINVAILEKALTLELRHFEDGRFYDRLTKARREASSRPLSVVTEGFQLVQNALTLLGYLALIVRYSALGGAGAVRGVGAGGDRRDVLLALGVPAAQLALARVAAAQLPRVRARERRARQGGEAVRARADAARALPRRWREKFYREDQPLAVRRAGWATVLSLLGHGRVLRLLRAGWRWRRRRRASRSAT